MHHFFTGRPIWLDSNASSYWWPHYRWTLIIHMSFWRKPRKAPYQVAFWSSFLSIMSYCFRDWKNLIMNPSFIYVDPDFTQHTFVFSWTSSNCGRRVNFTLIRIPLQVHHSLDPRETPAYFISSWISRFWSISFLGCSRDSCWTGSLKLATTRSHCIP